MLFYGLAGLGIGITIVATGPTVLATTTRTILTETVTTSNLGHVIGYVARQAVATSVTISLEALGTQVAQSVLASMVSIIIDQAFYGVTSLGESIRDNNASKLT